MNGIPVSPDRFLQNAPTWRPPNPFFGGLFWGVFAPLFSTFYIHTHKSYSLLILRHHSNQPTPGKIELN